MVENHLLNQILIKMMISFFGFSYLFVTWMALLSSDGVSAIINGNNITFGQVHHQFPYLVSYVNSTLDHWCGGSIISDEFVLTAAHCVIKDEETFYALPHLIIGGIDMLHGDEDSKVVVEVQTIFVDSRYNHSMWAMNTPPEYDWALLKLKTKLDIKNNPNLSIVELPKKIPGTEHYPTYENVTGVFAGFGYDYVKLVMKNKTGFIISVENESYDLLSLNKNIYTIADIGNSTGLLHWVNVKILNNEKCAVRNKNSSGDTWLCARIEPITEAPHGPCSGDSGSPLVFENTVIGLLTSSVTGCNENKSPSIYTNVASHVESIKNVMKGITVGMRISSTPAKHSLN